MNNNKWNLYTIKDYKKINILLDEHFNNLINAAKNKIKTGKEPITVGHDVRINMEEFMDTIKGYGASDTEPRSTLLNLICTELGFSLNKKTTDQL